MTRLKIVDGPDEGKVVLLSQGFPPGQYFANAVVQSPESEAGRKVVVWKSQCVVIAEQSLLDFGLED